MDWAERYYPRSSVASKNWNIQRSMSVVVLSERGTVGGPGSKLAYTAWIEAENVLVDGGGARLGLLDVHRDSRAIRARRVAGRGWRRMAGSSKLLPSLGSGLMESIEPADHLVFMAHCAWEMSLIERLGRLRRSAKTVSVWMPEVWPSGLDGRLRYEAYQMVDKIFVGILEVVDFFQDLAPNADVVCLPPAADVVTFGGPTLEPTRHIAVLGIGRRDADQHRRLRQWAEANEELYLYDTVQGTALSIRAHRAALAENFRHSRIAICNYGKHNNPHEIGDLRIVPGRLFEGLAAGAILIGMPPDENNQRQLVGDIVVESSDSDDLLTLVDKYNDQGAGRSMRLWNGALAARRHDWAHRWREVFAAIDEPFPEALSARLETLDARADELEALVSTG